MNRFKLLDVELKTSVAINRDDLPAGICDRNRNGHRDGVAHRSKTGGMVKPLRVQGRAGQQVDLNAGSGVADYQTVFRLDLGSEYLGQVED